MTPGPRRSNTAPPREEVLAAAMATIAERGLDRLTMAGARPRGRHEQRPSPLLLPHQGRAAAADPGVERGQARRRAEATAGPARPGPRAARRVRRPVRPRRPPRSALDALAGGLEPLAERRRRRTCPAGRDRAGLAPGPGGAAGRGRLARGVPRRRRRPLRDPAARPARRVQHPCGDRPAAAPTGAESSPMYGSSWTSRSPDAAARFTAAAVGCASARTRPRRPGGSAAPPRAGRTDSWSSRWRRCGRSAGHNGCPRPSRRCT